MARLANVTGGQRTQGTNDLTLAAARAQRDLSCQYTLGFYDDKVKYNEIKHLNVRVRDQDRRRLVTRHAERYEFRSEGAKKTDAITAAFTVPQMWESGIVRGHLFPLRPVDRKRWDTLVAVSFPVPEFEPFQTSVVREFGGVLQTLPKNGNPQVVHRFNRKVELRAPAQVPGVTAPKPSEREAVEDDGRRLRFLEHTELEPGRYELRVVLSTVNGKEVHSALMQIDVPEIPRKEFVLSGPVLGRPAGSDVVIQSASNEKKRRKSKRRWNRSDTEEEVSGDRVGSSKTFVPLLVQQTDAGDDLVALTQVCDVRRSADPDGMHVRRALSDQDGTTIGQIPTVELVLQEDGKVRCQGFVDQLPLSGLAAGNYRFDVELAPGDAAAAAATSEAAADFRIEGGSSP